ATIVQQGKALSFDNDLCFFDVRSGKFRLGLLVHVLPINQLVQTRGAEQLAAGEFFLDVLVVEPAVLARVGDLLTPPCCLVNKKVLRSEVPPRLNPKPGFPRSHPPPKDRPPKESLAPVQNKKVPENKTPNPTEHDYGERGGKPPPQPRPLVHNAPPIGRALGH